MGTYIVAFCLSFFAIFMKGLSQQNVIHHRKALMIPTSWLLASGEMFTAGIFVNNYLTNGWIDSIILALIIGTGGGLGCMVSLDFHSWLTKKIYRWDKEG